MPFIAALLVFVGFFFLHPFIPFPPHPGPDPCAGVSSSIRGLCKSYCTIEDCDGHDGSRTVCRQLRYNLVRITGREFFPCDITLPGRNTPTQPSEVDTPTPTLEPEATNTVEPTSTDTPIVVDTDTPTPTFTPIDTFTATSTPEGLASE